MSINGQCNFADELKAAKVSVKGKGKASSANNVKRKFNVLKDAKIDHQVNIAS